MRCEASSSALRRESQRGFSMMEILLSLFLLVIIITAVSRTSTNAKRVQQSAYFVEQASAFAQGKMDQLAAASLATVAAGADSVKTPMGLAFARSWAVDDRGDSKAVEVTVSWTSGGRAQGVKLATLVR